MLTRRRQWRAAKRIAARDYALADRRKSNQFARLFRNLFWLLLWIALAVHLYLLALRFVPVPYTINMIRDEGVTKNWMPLERISPQIVYAVIGAEDSRFCSHNGIDWDATKDAMEGNQQGEKRRGASGLTQQTAKNVFLWNGGGYARKAAEAYFAYAIDIVWGKRRVMEVYLNVAEWGDGYYGIEAASQARFGKSAAQLSSREAALLAAVLPSPNKWRVDPPGPYVSRRAGSLQQRAAVVRNEGLAKCIGLDAKSSPRVSAVQAPPAQTPALKPATPIEPQETQDSLNIDVQSDETPPAAETPDVILDPANNNDESGPVLLQSPLPTQTQSEPEPDIKPDPQPVDPQ
ncbi:monofunctional biosynthetic peptidoglycan transglycosylase [Robiginitomaculum antarcticum]|uniref:monofunctional biosynthetic peptidoglycan transglycosylase n=1 Tax=Robiginitomaculum antarcticum TaxID=437507 RepID=UPI0003794DC8|nr:monofunctional biosynthetic peptidoglycan transglycosylase [Robiginitomaculum antarcticum]